MGRNWQAFFISSVFLPAITFAAPVYKTTDATGNTIYTSKPPHEGAKPAELPEIMRGEVKLTKSQIASCSDHGGINCQVGADTDGSVICFDGFRGATAPFRFNCTSPKLEITDVTDPDHDGLIKVLVRNAKSVAAAKPQLLFKPEGGAEVTLTGPDEIEPFGIGEFLFVPSPGGGPVPKKLALAELTVTCANCP